MMPQTKELLLEVSNKGEEGPGGDYQQPGGWNTKPESLGPQLDWNAQEAHLRLKQAFFLLVL